MGGPCRALRNGVTLFLACLSLASVSHLCKKTPSDTALSLWIGLGRARGHLLEHCAPWGGWACPLVCPLSWPPGPVVLTAEQWEWGLWPLASLLIAWFCMSPSLQALALACQVLFHGAQALCKPGCLLWFILLSPGDLGDTGGLWPACVPERGSLSHSHMASDSVQMRVRILMVDFGQVAPGPLPQFPHRSAGVITLASRLEDYMSSGSVNALPVEFSFGAVTSVLRCASRCRWPARKVCGSVSTVFWSWKLVGRLEGLRLWCPLEGEPGKPTGERDACVCRDPPSPQGAVGTVIQQALLCSSHVVGGLTLPICKMGSVS